MKRSKAPSALAAKKTTPSSSGPSAGFKSPFASSATSTPKKEKEEEKPQTKVDEPVQDTNNDNNNSNDNENEAPKVKSTTFKAPFKSPVTTKSTAKVAVAQSAQEEVKESIVYIVIWGNYTTKKHKSYNNDGVLQITGKTVILKDMEGKDVGRTVSISKKTLDELFEGSTIKVAGKEVEILRRIPEEEFTSGKVFLESQQAASAPPAKSMPTSSALTKKKFKSHAVAGSGDGTNTREPLKPRHDPDSDGAVVLWRPSVPFDSSGKPQVAVVVDPHVATNLRPHQRQGVKFMYNCVMGGVQEGTGCILADEMGLGKTLQSIALIWTLLKQGPHGQPTAKKVVVVTPASLIDNWRKEVKRWLGSERLKPISISDTTKGAKDMIIEFIKATIHPILFITYEQCRMNAPLMEKIVCGLVICDEGHRIKNSSSKTAIAISKIQTTRRIILSGTPLQNDLEEFYSMVDFCNPGVLGSLPSFKKLFGQTIITGRFPNAKPEERKIGQARSKQLTEMTSKFILRRKANILEKYLPPKIEEVVFCKMSPLQVQFYKLFLRSKTMTGLLSGQDAYALECVTSLKKLTNHPSLIWNLSHGLDENGEKTTKKHGFDGCDRLFPADFDPKSPQPEFSGKVQVLASLLKAIKQSSNDKVVLVSNSKKTLNIFQQLLDQDSHAYVRLDGDLPIPQRQKIVDEFNSPSSNLFAFLLSSRAGGVGLNLIGANRLILFDPDWNPANDKQAMARIWRDGQTKPVWIYRFLSVGTIDEKIYQRQIMKQGLSNSVVDDEVNSKRHFKNEDLKNIFSLNENTLCDTHDLIKCHCLSSERKADKDDAAKKSEISSWFHYADPEKYLDPVLKGVAKEKDSPISFVFCSPPADIKKEEKEEDIVNEAAREDIYMCTEDSKKEDEEVEGENGGEEEEEKQVKKAPRRTKSKKAVVDDDDDYNEEMEAEKIEEEVEDEEEMPKKKRAKKQTEEAKPVEDKAQESPNDKVRVRGRLVKKVEDDDLDALELEV